MIVAALEDLRLVEGVLCNLLLLLDSVIVSSVLTTCSAIPVVSIRVEPSSEVRGQGIPWVCGDE
jgi:hypothetical protein